MEKSFNMKWWHKSVVYQIYPKSFNDTTGNGQGDGEGACRRDGRVRPGNAGADARRVGRLRQRHWL